MYPWDRPPLNNQHNPHRALQASPSTLNPTSLEPEPQPTNPVRLPSQPAQPTCPDQPTCPVRLPNHSSPHHPTQPTAGSIADEVLMLVALQGVRRLLGSSLLGLEGQILQQERLPGRSSCSCCLLVPCLRVRGDKGKSEETTNLQTFFKNTCLC